MALPDLEQAKAAVLNSVTSASGQRPYDHAITEFRRLVLFGAAAGVQPHRRAPLSHPPRAAPLRAGHDQPEARSGPTRGLRGSRCRSPQSGAGGEHTPREGRAAPQGAVRKLADGGTGPALLRTEAPLTLRGLRDHAMVALLLGCGLLAARRCLGTPIGPATSRALGHR